MMSITIPTVVVTRPQAQAQGLIQWLTRQGLHPIAFPTLTISPFETTPALENLSTQVFDVAIFISTNAVEYGLPWLWNTHKQLPDSLQLAAVGQTTAQALEDQGLRVAVVPTEPPYNSESLLAQPALQQIMGKRILIVCGEGGRPYLEETLQQRGAQVTRAAVYKRGCPHADITALLTQRVDMVTMTSVEALKNLQRLLGPRHAQWLSSIPLVVMSQRIAQIAQSLGLSQIHVAPEVSEAGLRQAILQLAWGEGVQRHGH